MPSTHIDKMHKSQMKCPLCGEEKDIFVSSYKRAWYDTPITALECYCHTCGQYFYPTDNEDERR